MTKKVINKNVFPYYNQVFKLRNLVSFKRWDVVKDENF